MRAVAGMTVQVAAVDLGAESGRVTVVSFDGARFCFDVAARFPNGPVVTDGVLRWDVNRLWGEISSGLGRLACAAAPIASVGVDAWGVDYGLLGATGALLDDPVSYRDGRNQASFDAAVAELGAGRLYRSTGVQLLPINTLFGLLTEARDQPERLEAATTLLMIADIFHHRLSGARVSESTSVSTSGAYDMAVGAWATDLLDALRIPTHMLPEVVPAGTDVGPLTGAVATGSLADTRVIVPAAHDTASAVVATPLTDPGSLYISSGTWSLAGVEAPAPVITERSRSANLTNEGGYAGTTRLLRNVMGLWILQECRRHWGREGHQLSYAELVGMAGAETPLVSVVDPDDPVFLRPGDMPRRVRDYCARHGVPVPHSIAAVTRCVIDSLALSYRCVVDDIAMVTGRRPASINIVGGGAQNELLSQLAADATGLPVRCGPVEATALGNAAVQLSALGELAGLAEIREAVGASTTLVDYLPATDSRWDPAYDCFMQLRAARRDPSVPWTDELGRHHSTTEGTSDP